MVTKPLPLRRAKAPRARARPEGYLSQREALLFSFTPRCHPISRQPDVLPCPAIGGPSRSHRLMLECRDDHRGVLSQELFFSGPLFFRKTTSPWRRTVVAPSSVVHSSFVHTSSRPRPSPAVIDSLKRHGSFPLRQKAKEADQAPHPSGAGAGLAKWRRR